MRIRLAIVFGLLIASLVVVEALTWRVLIAEPVSPRVESASTDPAVGTLFYTELNRVLRGEAVGDLHRVVTDDFVNHSTIPGRSDGMDGLTQQLRTYGRTFPGVRFSVERIDSTGNDLVVRLARFDPPPGEVASLTLDPVGLPGGVEILHFRQGRISERWPTPLPELSAATIDRASTTLYSRTTDHARLYRIGLPSGGELSWITPSLATLMVEEGILSLVVEKTDELGRPKHERVDVPAGSAVLLPAETPVQLRGNSMHPTSVLLFDAYSADSALPRPFDRTGWATSTLLWMSPSSMALTTSWRIEIGLAAIPAQSTVSLGNPSALEILLIASGAPLWLGTSGGTAEYRDEKHVSTSLTLPATVPAGGAVHLSDADSAVIRNSGDESDTTWLITIAPLARQLPDHEVAP